MLWEIVKLKHKMPHNISEESPKTLIFVVAYNAVKTISSVFDRLPKQVINNPNFHILVIDDCSLDATASTAAAHVRTHKYGNVSILRNNRNMGYGGNQKLGYRYAIDHGYDLVVLLHGDGQYAPELVLEFVTRWNQSKPGVILGSRMINKAAARAGGMPMYKWIGNQILTRFQNRVVGSLLSEFHTGFRAYDVKQFISRVPFELNTDEFHFDTEILLQAFALGVNLVEFAIPTHYGDEISRVNGMKYAWDVCVACLTYRFQRIGLFCSMQYRGLLEHDERYQDKSGQTGTTHDLVVRRVEKRTRVLDLGCGPGFVANRLAEKGCEVVAVDSVMPKNLNSAKFVQLNFEKELLREDLSNYSFVLMLDLLEHISDPERLLINLRYSTSCLKVPRFLLSTGNVAFLGPRLLLGLGFFTYGERGILDITHKRLFTVASFKRMLRESGYHVLSVKGIGVPFRLLFPNWFGGLLGFVSNSLAHVWPSMFGYQILVEAEPKPHSFTLLADAKQFVG
jgi:glycosyltransferase involved in cell wall biosynthesis